MGILQTQLKLRCADLGLRYVDTRGPVGATLLYVAEAPGEQEAKDGAPLVGPSGRLADRIISEAGVASSDIWFTNPYKVRPPDNDLSQLASLGIPLVDYEQAFFEQLMETKPTIIVTAGETPTRLLLPHLKDSKGNVSLTKYRGNLLTSSLLPWPHYVIPCYHPAFLFQDWSERDLSVFVLSRAKEELDYFKQNGTLRPLPTRTFITEPSYDDAIEFLTRLLHTRSRISVDIETLRRKFPYVVGIADSPNSAMALTLVPDWDEQRLSNLWRLLDETLRTCSQIGQNYTVYDVPYLQSIGFRPILERIDDTLIRHHVLWPELSHKLQFMTMQYTREPYYKDEGKTWATRSGGGVRQWKEYCCKDVCVTYEIFEEQEKEFAERPHLRRFYEEYEMPLARRMVNVEKRGLAVNEVKLKDLRNYIDTELAKHVSVAANLIGAPTFPDKDSADAFIKETGTPWENVVNLGSQKQMLKVFESLGIKIHKNRDGRDSLAEEFINKMFAESGHELLKEMIVVREFGKVLGTYVKAKLWDGVLYCSYIVAGTVGGRRSSRKNHLGLGTNHQNLPKHSPLGKRFRECIVARPERIFVSCDQVQAEDWVVCGIIADQSGDTRSLDELRAGVDRHRNLAAFIFSLPLDQCGKDTMQRYIGKRTRHAGNYGMAGEKMSVILAGEGFNVTRQQCDFFLAKFHEFDPNIRGVFHKYVENELVTKRKLVSPAPFGRERDFFTVRPYGNNNQTFREAYSYIPQSTVGDNTGHALLWLEENHEGLVVMETHDAITLEVEDNDAEIWRATQILKQAFDRTLMFPNGLRINIPIEYEVGYDLHPKHTVTVSCANLDEVGLKATLSTFRQERKNVGKPTRVLCT